MIEDDGGFMRREQAYWDAEQHADTMCEECDQVIEDTAIRSDTQVFCSEGCKEENRMWKCEMREIAKHEREYE